MLQLGPHVLGLSRGGTVYDLDESLSKVTSEWSVASGARWSAMGADANGTVLAVGDQAGQLRLWSVADHTPITAPVMAHPGGVNAIAIRSDGKLVVTLGAGDNLLKTWAVTPNGLQAVGSVALGATGAAAAFIADEQAVAVGESNGAVQLFDAATLTLRPDFGSNGTRQLHTTPITQLIPVSDPDPTKPGGFVTVGLDGWVMRLTGNFDLFSSRRATEGTPLAAAVDRSTGLTLIASADGTTSVADKGVSSDFGVTTISGNTALQFGDSAADDRAVIVRFGSGDDANAATVTFHAVEPGGVLRKGRVAQTGSLPNVASASALGGSDVAVVDYSGVVRRYHGSRRPRSSTSAPSWTQARDRCCSRSAATTSVSSSAGARSSTPTTARCARHT